MTIVNHGFQYKSVDQGLFYHIWVKRVKEERFMSIYGTFVKLSVSVFWDFPPFFFRP